MPAKTRFSVSLNVNEYAELATMAEKHRVSMAWLVRNAVAEFLDRYRKEETQLPLRLTPVGSQRPPV
ncbi:MAG: ribbon-helix-helix domain-containing protein [Caldilineaceae bacterium]|nr:ribbon-helix-helix domain-containing protein [Caldilineaceae bacterium]